MEAQKGRGPYQSCDPEGPKQAAECFVLLRHDREERRIHLHYLGVPMEPRHQTGLREARCFSESHRRDPCARYQ